ncbi:unnamed protein product, partial [Effrenium voratum]
SASTKACRLRPRCEMKPLERALERLRRALQRAPRELRQRGLLLLKPKVQACLLGFMEGPKPTERLPCAELTAGACPRTRSFASLTCMGRLYRAQVFLLSMRILTVAVPSRAQAMKFQQVLRLAREALSDATGVDAELVTQALRHACQSEGLALKDLGLAFRAEVRGRPYVKRDIWGRYSLDLDRALRERQQLLDAKASGWPALRDAWIFVLRGDQVSESSLLRANIFLRQEPVLVRRGAPKGWARHRGHSAVEARNVPRAERLKGAPKKQAEAIVDARQPGSLPKALRQLSGHEAAWATHGKPEALPEEPSLGHRKAARPRPVGDGRAPKMRRREVRINIRRQSNSPLVCESAGPFRVHAPRIARAARLVERRLEEQERWADRGALRLACCLGPVQ